MTTDLYAEGFPHGFKEGYEAGCRGSACPAALMEGGMACRDAQIRYNGDYQYRKAIDAGTPWVEPAPAPKKTTSAKPAPTRMPAPDPAPTPKPMPPAPTEQPASELGAEIVALPRTRNTALLTDPDFPHGTPNGHNRGCRNADECPSDPSCHAVFRAYNRKWYAQQKRKAMKSALTAPENHETPEATVNDETIVTAPDLTSSLAQLSADRYTELHAAKAELQDAQLRIGQILAERDAANAERDAIRRELTLHLEGASLARSLRDAELAEHPLLSLTITQTPDGGLTLTLPTSARPR